jgi:hypothetical protein
MPMTMKALDIAKVYEDKDRLSYLHPSRFGSKMMKICVRSGIECIELIELLF